MKKVWIVWASTELGHTTRIVGVFEKESVCRVYISLVAEEARRLFALRDGEKVVNKYDDINTSRSQYTHYGLDSYVITHNIPDSDKLPQDVQDYLKQED